MDWSPTYTPAAEVRAMRWVPEDLLHGEHDIRRLLEEWGGGVARLSKLNEEAVNGIVAFLEWFMEATKALEASKRLFTWSLFSSVYQTPLKKL